ncbi:hypothetical protein TNCT_701191 [Trichonephila clavata]|uniref:Uncharacterized protein n=1 Tax=Trichonephila clavata TaxID=2740835 RepID=A0A8X6G078_TRICU|nr:hypothetical protein TNCT_701191 [Trichonephila clavata]
MLTSSLSVDPIESLSNEEENRHLNASFNLTSHKLPHFRLRHPMNSNNIRPNSATQREDRKACLVKWKDKKSVLLSNAFGIKPEGSCKRWAKVQRQRADVRQPAIARSYNTYMGGFGYDGQTNLILPDIPTDQEMDNACLFIFF